MSQFGISGVWKDSNLIITHYAFHTVNENSISSAVKTLKAEAIRLLEISGNTAVTWLWNYTGECWNIGEIVTVVNGVAGKYLRSQHDGKLIDNLAHLIDFDWINP